MIIPDQGTKEWLDWRKTMLGASDIPVIMDESPYKTPYRLWQEKKGLVQTFETEAMREGKRLEPEILQMFADEIGYAILPVRKPLIHPNYPNFMASLDGMSFCRTIGCELKSANITTHEIAKANKVPSFYYGQVQWQMFVADFSEWYYVSYGKTCGTLSIVKVQRDQEYIDLAIERAKNFLIYLSDSFGPPHKEYETNLTLEQQQYAYDLSEIINQRIYWEKKEEELKDKAFEILGGIETQACGIRYEKTSRKGNIDYSKIPELKNIDLEQYRKPTTEFFRITLI